MADLAAVQLTGPARMEVDSVRAGLREPLRLAVVGRVKAGKSTLVNALLGQCVAPTDVSECTRLVTWFRYGHPQRVEVVLRDGTSRQLPLDADGRLPRSVGSDPAQVRCLNVWLSNELLRTLTLVDTPGLASLNREVSEVTEEFLSVEQDSAAATASADAVVFVLNQNMRTDELETLRAFRTRAGELRGSAVNAVGVLTKADKVGGGGPDAWQQAERLARAQGERFRADVSVVLPVIGLIAESCEAALVTEADAANLAAMAELSPAERAPLLWSAARFMEDATVVPQADRGRLLQLLDLHGIEQAVSLIEEGVEGAYALRGRLSELSGVRTLRATLLDIFGRRSDALKARQALNVLDAASYRADAAGPDVLAALRGRVEQLRLDPTMHELAELEAFHACCSGDLSLPPALDDELREWVIRGGEAVLAHGAAQAEPREAALAGVARWRTFLATAASPRQAPAARTMIRSYQLAIGRLPAAEGSRS